MGRHGDRIALVTGAASDIALEAGEAVAKASRDFGTELELSVDRGSMAR